MLATGVLSETTLRFVLLGMATGSLAGLVGLGVVVVHRASGVLNFAAGALGGVSAFVCYSLRDDHGWPAWLAVAAGVGLGAALGAGTHVVLALLRNASLLSRLIATLGLLSAAQGITIVIWGGDTTQPDTFLPSRNVTLFGDVRIGLDRLVVIGLVAVLALGLRLLYTKSLFGLATAAVAESRRVAAGSGWSVGRIELSNFVLAGGLSALAAILLAPIVTLTAAVLAVSVLPALAAALVGRFSSFGATVAAALAIGVVQSELALFQPDLAEAFGVSAPSLTGLPQVVPLVVIIGYTVATGRARLQRGDVLVRLPMPGTGQVSVVPLAVGVALAGGLLWGVDGWADALITTFALAVVVCSVVVVTGYAGQLSLCQLALAGFGAWVAGRLISVNGWPLEIALPAAVLSTVAVGAIVALPALRTRGVNLAVATLAVSLMLEAIVFRNAAITGGFTGLPVDPPTFAGIDIDPATRPERYGAFALVLLICVGLVVANVRRGRVGRRMLAVRSNERAAASLGVSIVGVKLYAFALSAGIAAVGGVLLALTQPNVGFSRFDVFGSILLVQFAVVGGIGWVSGAVAGAAGAPGAAVSHVASDLFPDAVTITAWLAFAAGVVVLLVVWRAPDGMAALNSHSYQRLVARVRQPRTQAMAVGTEPGRERQPVPLELNDVTVRFGGVVALNGVSLSVQPGEVVGLIGPNGAGKTTLLDVASGFTPQTSGTVSLDGSIVDRWTPERRARTGIARSWQAVELFDAMTVRENLLVATDDQRPLRYLTDLVRPGRPRMTAVLRDVIEEFELAGILDDRPGALSQGMARLVGIARAVAAEPAVLLLDEPAAGLDREESAELAVMIKSIASRRGIGILIVEHDVPLLLSTCDRLVVLDFGVKIAEGTPAEVSADPRVIQAYLGDDAAAESSKVGRSPADGTSPAVAEPMPIEEVTP